MSKKQPNLKNLFGINVVVSLHVPDDKIVLIGKEEWKDPSHFTRKLSIWDLKTGVVSGNCYEGEVQVIHASQKNKDFIADVCERHSVTH